MGISRGGAEGALALTQATKVLSFSPKRDATLVRDLHEKILPAAMVVPHTWRLRPTWKYLCWIQWLSQPYINWLHVDVGGSTFYLHLIYSSYSFSLCQGLSVQWHKSGSKTYIHKRTVPIDQPQDPYKSVAKDNGAQQTSFLTFGQVSICTNSTSISQKWNRRLQFHRLPEEQLYMATFFFPQCQKITL